MRKIIKTILVTGVLGTIIVPYASYTQAQLVFRNTITGEQLDFSFAKKGEDTEELKHFLNTGENLYNDNEDALVTGEDFYLTACSGCHGHYAEGKLGPALGDDYWTYPKNKNDKGLFETIYGGARAMMGPQYKQLSLDEMLKVMSYMRSIYWGSVDKADWLTDEQRANFSPAKVPKDYEEALKRHQEQS